MAKPKNKPEGKRPWRENIEALTMAIVVALLFKYFILEISKIPSGSMQPTLMGDPSTQVFDRVMVDKLSMRMRDPKRWEIVVFKHPVERSRVMVKRLVGMPGEEFLVAKGDLWTRPNEESEWTILRRPDSVQEEMWRAVDWDDPERSPWKVVTAGERWRIDGRDVTAKGPGKIRFREDFGPLADDYHDGYPEAVRPTSRRRGPRTVGDLRVSGSLLAENPDSTFTIELTEGARAYVFSIPMTGKASIRVKGGDGLADTVTSEVQLDLSGSSVDFSAQNLDDELLLIVDGEKLCRLEVPSTNDQTAYITLGLGDGNAELEGLWVERDIYYLPDPDRSVTRWRTKIPDGHYIMLGDNTQDSADSRDWKAKRAYLRSDRAQENPVTARGNFRPRENPIQVPGPDGTPVYRFLDEWGEVHWLPTAEHTLGLEFRAPTVPRELILGRAVSVFWPIKPIKGLWRLTWLH